MKTLVLITSQFPFGKGEPFLETELPIVSTGFEKVIIISLNVTLEKTRSIPDEYKIFRYNTSTSFSVYLFFPVLVFQNCGVIKELIKEEALFRRSIHDPFTIKKLLILFKRIIKAFELKNFIQRKLTEEGINENIVFYSYWLKTGAHAIAMLKYRDSIKISRAHGSDIYEEKTKSGYLALLKFSSSNLNAIFFVSTQGLKYFEEKLKVKSPNFIVSYLGVEKPDSKGITAKEQDKYLVVSCSNLIPLKRIDRIINSLAIVKSDKNILWLHFGDGILRNELEALAENKLGPLDRIDYSFMGHYLNKELLQYYCSNKIDLFINTSSTEGVPVSIMEALSFGIPVIATDVGGVKELVVEGTGILLPAEFKIHDLTKNIEFFLNLSVEEELKFRKNAYSNWEMNFNASVNYRDFIMRVNSIFATVK
jgi:glycosyltransferase involved in cell wall biosynthesis